MIRFPRIALYDSYSRRQLATDAGPGESVTALNPKIRPDLRRFRETRVVQRRPRGTGEADIWPGHKILPSGCHAAKNRAYSTQSGRLGFLCVGVVVAEATQQDNKLNVFISYSRDDLGFSVGRRKRREQRPLRKSRFMSGLS
jgi:hypothetical protein